MKKNILICLLCCFLYGSLYAGVQKMITLPDEYRLVPLAPEETVLGLSPDGKILATCDYGAKSGYIRLYSTDNFKMTAEIKLAEKQMLPFEKKAVWSPDGKYVTFRSVRKSPIELIMFKNSCIYIINVDTGKLIQISDDKYKNAVDLLDSNLYFDPSFTFDGKYVIYHKYTSEGMQIISSRIEYKKEEILISNPTRANTIFAFPLGETKILINQDTISNSEPNKILIFDTKSRNNKLLLEEEIDLDSLSMFEIRDLSLDRRKVLVYSWKKNKKSSGNNIDKLYVLEFYPNGEYSNIITIGQSEDQKILTANLTPDGKSLVFVAREEKAAGKQSQTSQLVVMDLQSGERRILMTDTDDVDIPGSYVQGYSRGTSEGLFLSDSKMLIHCSDGFRLYTLK
jgi:Tol biopolymer transport system component